MYTTNKNQGIEYLWSKEVEAANGWGKPGDRPGIFACSDTPIVTALIGSVSHYVQEHFESEGLTKAEICLLYTSDAADD